MYIKGLIVAPFLACEINPSREVLFGCVRMYALVFMHVLPCVRAVVHVCAVVHACVCRWFRMSELINEKDAEYRCTRVCVCVYLFMRARACPGWLCYVYWITAV